MDNIGWQSWSPPKPAQLRIPIRNYAPFPVSPTILRSTQGKKRRYRPITGWCSWHAHGTHISEKLILASLRAIKTHKIPLTHILIDDGWTKWGDWLTPDTAKFPNGLRVMANAIQQAGWKPGLWIAPFLVDPKSTLFHNHPDWCIQTPSGRFLEGRKITPIDYLLPYRRYVLDLTKPEVRVYVQNVIDTIISAWGFRFLKLDFLYAQHFNPRFRSPVKPDALLHTFLKTIKKKHPTVHIDACGCPFRAAMGVVDSMRISEDIVNPQLRFLSPFNTLIHSARLRMLKENVDARRQTDCHWLLNPDAFVCSKAFGFSTHQIRELALLIGKANGVVFLGDDVTTLSRRDAAVIRSFLRTIG